MLFIQRWIKRPAVDTNANRDFAVARLGRNCLDVFWFANVAGIQAQSCNTCFHCSKSHLVLMVNVSDDRQRRSRNNLCKPFSCFLFIASTSNDVTSRRGESINLLQRAFNIGGLGGGH